MRTPVVSAESVDLPTKPILRGWLHAGTFPLAVLAGIGLVVAAPPGRVRLGMALFGASAALLFGVSALYHRVRWSPRTQRFLRRLDHANIFLIIAGTTSAFGLSLLPPSDARLLLTVVWVGAIAGVVLKVAWPEAPRWIGVPAYIALGWTCVGFASGLASAGGPAVMTLITIGGVLYTIGGVVYGLKKPNPAPLRFGFHEVFHLLTVLAFAAHVAAAALVVAQTSGGGLAS